MDCKINYSMPIAKSTNHSNVQFKGKEQVAKVATDQALKHRNGVFAKVGRRGQLFIATSLLACLLEFVSFDTSGRTIGQNAVRKAKRAVLEYRANKGDPDAILELSFMNMVDAMDSNDAVNVLRGVNKELKKYNK